MILRRQSTVTQHPRNDGCRTNRSRPLLVLRRIGFPGTIADLSLQRVVASIQVVGEKELTIAIVRGEIHDVHRNLFRQIHRPVISAGLHGFAHTIGRPSENEFGHLVRMFQADTPMTRRTIRVRKERLGWRVVQIDVEVVREHELHETKRVLSPRLLSHALFSVITV